MTWPAVKRGFLQQEFREYVEELNWLKWRPNKIVWHNTAAPTLKQWIETAAKDQHEGRVPGITRIRNLEAYFRDNNGWPGAPHLFVANDLIWVFNSLTSPGTHSPSWNTTSIGIEMIGDFSKEDDDSGEGKKVKDNTIFATAVICTAVGIDPNMIYLHKQDPKTTHDCPGKNIAKDKTAMIETVRKLMTGGEHNPMNDETPVSPHWHAEVTTPDLNLRRGPSVMTESMGKLPKGTRLIVLDKAGNWLKVTTPAGYTGWVSGNYTKEIKS